MLAPPPPPPPSATASSELPEPFEPARDDLEAAASTVPARPAVSPPCPGVAALRAPAVDILPPVALPVPLLCPARSHAVSPTSVVCALPGSARPQHSASALHYVATQLQRIYDAGARAGWFDVHFHRGARRSSIVLDPGGGAAPRRVVTCEQQHAVRRLSTQYLAEPSTDGWNVVAGAIELARQYALDATTIFHVDPPSVDRATRMRLAACLTVAWKFARSLPGGFKHQFTAADGTMHTLELAVMHAAFLTRSELECLGAWPTEVERWQQMQDVALQSEASLLDTGLVFPALSENPICTAEAALQELYEHRIPGADTHERVLQLRALLPFFLRIALDAEHAVYEREVARAAAPDLFANALLACAFVAHTSTFVPTNGTFATACRAAVHRARQTFSMDEFTLAAEIVAVGSALAGRAPARQAEVDDAVFAPWSGCYGDPSWTLYSCVSRPRVRALHVAFLA